jgi:hypothetical protein
MQNLIIAVEWNLAHRLPRLSEPLFKTLCEEISPSTRCSTTSTIVVWKTTQVCGATSQTQRMLKIRIEGLGLHDLLRHSGRPFIRTPLRAEVTFRDDPLRLLRSIRFASRFGGTVHDEIFAAARNTMIRVSRSHHVPLKPVDVAYTIGSADDEDQS